MSITVQLKPWGNSQGIRISREIHHPQKTRKEKNASRICGSLRRKTGAL